MSDPLRILIVEDEAILAMDLEAMLEEQGHEVVGWAPDAAQARKMLTNLDVDLAFVDINLGRGETGIALARHMADNHHSTVVFLTANPGRVPEDFAGACGVIAKPYTRRMLGDALRYLEEGVRRPPPVSSLPPGFTLSPAYLERWG